MNSSRISFGLAVLVLLLPVFARAVTAAPPPSPGDGREVLANTKSVPAKYVGFLYFDDPRPAADRPSLEHRIRKSTAFLVSPKHIVTCAHCITNHPEELKKSGDKPYPRSADFGEEGFASSIYFAPGHHGPIRTPTDGKETPDSQPYGRYRVVAVTQMFSQYRRERNAQAAGKYDLVVLELDRDTTPAVGGHFKVSESHLGSGDSGNTVLQINGYDADCSTTTALSDGHEQLSIWQLTRKGDVQARFRNAVRSFHYQANLTCKAFGGASGSPIWVNEDGGPTAVGITISSDRNSKNEAVGLFFTKEHVEFIERGINGK